jgi:hypothetical protein
MIDLGRRARLSYRRIESPLNSPSISATSSQTWLKRITYPSSKMNGTQFVEREFNSSHGPGTKAENLSFHGLPFLAPSYSGVVTMSESSACRGNTTTSGAEHRNEHLPDVLAWTPLEQSCGSIVVVSPAAQV